MCGYDLCGSAVDRKGYRTWRNTLCPVYRPKESLRLHTPAGLGPVADVEEVWGTPNDAEHYSVLPSVFQLPQ